MHLSTRLYFVLLPALIGAASTAAHQIAICVPHSASLCVVSTDSLDTGVQACTVISSGTSWRLVPDGTTFAAHDYSSARPSNETCDSIMLTTLIDVNQ